jgi:predicted nucleic acid-binding protein
LLQEPEWAVPALWRSELRNVLALYLRKSLIDFAKAFAIQTEMEAMLHNREYNVSSLDVLSLVSQSECSAYDCEFVALAKSFRCKLVTMDKKLAQAFPDTAILLTDWIF